MPHNQKKYHPHKQEPPKATNTFFKTNKEQAARRGIINNQLAHVSSSILPIKEVALKLVKTLKKRLKSSQPEQAQLNQSKALELANQILATDIYHIQFIQEALANICTTLKESRYTNGLCIERTYGSEEKCIPLGQNFQHQHLSLQLKNLLEQTIKKTAIPPLPSTAVGKYEDSPTSEKWAIYLMELIQLLPPEPLLTTGTPTSWSSSKQPILPQEEDENNPDEQNPDDSDDNSPIVNNNTSGGFGRNILNLFRRKRKN